MVFAEKEVQGSSISLNLVFNEYLFSFLFIPKKDKGIENKQRKGNCNQNTH